MEQLADESSDVVAAPAIFSDFSGKQSEKSFKQRHSRAQQIVELLIALGRLPTLRGAQCRSLQHQIEYSVSVLSQKEQHVLVSFIVACLWEGVVQDVVVVSAARSVTTGDNKLVTQTALPTVREELVYTGKPLRCTILRVELQHKHRRSDPPLDRGSQTSWRTGHRERAQGDKIYNAFFLLRATRRPPEQP